MKNTKCNVRNVCNYMVLDDAFASNCNCHYGCFNNSKLHYQIIVDFLEIVSGFTVQFITAMVSIHDCYYE